MRVLIGLVCTASAIWCAGASETRVRDAAARAIALVEHSQENWYAKQTCFSCHHQLMPALAFRAAREHGIPVNESIAHADAAKTFAYTDLDQAVQYTYVIEPAMTDAFELVAAEAAGVRRNLVTAVYARLIAGRQTAAGDWPSFHQRPPSSYSSFTMTALALRALQLYGHPSQKADTQARVARGRAWLLAHSPRDTEERTYQLLGLAWAGGAEREIAKAARALAATQQADGGWSSMAGLGSEAYSTGEALVALHDAGGMPTSDASWQRGIEFLLKSQAADGSWHVPSRLNPSLPVSPPYFETGYPYGHDQFISASGAAWAVMALARALGPARTAALPELKEAQPAAVPSWAETILFGTAADVKRLLDGGFDPNSATPAGTTALMMAAPDAAKMKLLLDRGANVNARAKTKYSALMVAAQYADSTAAINLLLDRGAEVALPAGQGAALFNAHPLFLAAYAGNAEILSRLHAAGDSVEDPMVLIGTSSATPLMGAVRFGNLAVVRALLDIGAGVDRADGSGMTPLIRAVLGNQVEIARFLIERGANVNHVDKTGMTALLWAASIDFGDSQMTDLLLKSGARTDARTKDGLTALELARKYKYAHPLASLSPHIQ